VGTAAPTTVRTPKHLTLGTSLEPDARPTASITQRVIQPFISPGLTVLDGQGNRQAILAQEVPSLENGLWVLNPDGTMLTTYRIRPGAQWHDGVPLSSDDLVFSLQVGRDPDLSAFGNPAYPAIDTVSAPDAQTLVVAWKRSFIAADGLLDASPDSPLPRHLLESVYPEHKADLLDLPYWTQEFVGTGPFKVREWTPGVGVSLTANEAYVLGRPKVDSIDVQLIGDANAFMAGLLAGSVDIASSLGSPELGLQLRDQWKDGRVVFSLNSGTWMALFPQFIDPRPAIIGDVRFRTAMALAIDRAAITEAVTGGVSPVPQSFLSPNQPQYAPIEASLPRYDYDSGRSSQILAELGYALGGDGMYRDRAGTPLQIDLLSGPLDQAAKPMAAIADYWKQVGVATTTTRLTQQRANDYAYIAPFPGFLIFNRQNDVAGMRHYQSADIQLPSNNFKVPGVGNAGRYSSPEMDALVDDYFATVPIPERLGVLDRIVHITTGQLIHLGLFYNPQPGAVAGRVTGVSPQWWQQSIAWNAQDWDVVP
jgi:peptide/nickel transport system substrate-binding protein